MLENGGRKGGRQGTNGLCVTKTNAWKTVRCESVERKRGGEGLSDHFLVETRLKLLGGWRSGGRMEGMRNVLNVSELNHSLKKGHTRRACMENMMFREVGRSRVWRRSGKSSEIW